MEDDEDSRFVLEEILDYLGYDCDAAENGEQLFELLAGNPDAYQAILMDIHMPRITGIDATMQIRRQTPEGKAPLPIIAVTADVNFHAAESVRQFGFTDVLPKPLRIAAVEDMLSELVG